MSNHLRQETSPYLQQHADNPVDWHPWSRESLRLAQEQRKPILLSIGYSACHWCHVMAHECFEDAEVAALMNERFVNIKVDREERPDLDQIYQNALVLLTGRSGGWPLTMFLSPDGTPFFGGTYFPKYARHNLPAFPDVLERTATFYAQHRKELHAQGEQLIAALAEVVPKTKTAGMQLDGKPLHLAVRQLHQSFDSVHGGLGSVPKFPHAVELDFLLRHSHAERDEHARSIVLHTLRQMANGGIYDQLGGGFCRYSVDEHWDIPHFEKMLYDNGLLLALYSDAWQSSREPLFAQVVEETAAWVMREMQAPEGGYYSSLDADSEHEEGRYYVWQRDEVRSLLTAEEFSVAAPYYGMDQPANFDQLAWHLRVSESLEEVAGKLGLRIEQAGAHLANARKKLLAARERRVRPGRDEKILGAWNGLMITGMARAARAFSRGDWLNSAQRAMDCVRHSLWHDGKLLATCRDGKAHLNAYLDDHAFLLQAAMELLQARFRHDDLAFAMQLGDALLARFEDSQGGGFFFTSHDHEALIQRNKIGQDNATPAGNGVAAHALQRLSVITGGPEYAEAAARCLKLFYPALQQAAGYHCSLCTALAEYLQPPSLLILRGEPVETQPWQNKLTQHYLPHVIALALDGQAGGLPQALDKPQSPQPAAWLCKGTQCLPPISSAETLLQYLDASH